MRKPVIAGLVLVAMLFAGTGLLYSEVPDPDGLPDIQGSWTGKVRVKAWDLTGNGESEKFKESVEVDVLQKGFSVLITIYPGDGPSIEMEGVVGDGRFWAYGESEAGPLVMVGKIRNKGRKIIANLLGGEGPVALEVKVQMKKDKEQPS